jgi:hypothetical protein
MPVHCGEIWSSEADVVVSVNTARSDKLKIGLSAPEAMHTASQRRGEAAVGNQVKRSTNIRS